MGAILYAHRGAALRRRHAVRQPVPGLRGAVGRHEEDAGGPAGVHSDRKVAGPRANMNALPRHQGARGRRLARDRERCTRWCARIPRRAASCSIVNHSYTVRLRGHDGGGEQAAARLPARARPPARSSPAASAGRRARSPSGTTACASTSPSTTPARSAASCGARRSPAGRWL